MSAWMTAFHFLEPRWLWLLLLLPVVVWLVGRRPGESRALSRLADAALLPYLLDGTPAKSRTPAVAVAVAAVLAVLALAGPAWDRQSQPLFAERAAQVIVVSMSPHMLSKDIVPDRLSRARYKVRELYAANRDGMNALIAYTGEAFTVAPLTIDAHSVDDLLTALAPDTMPVEGDDPGKAIDMAAELIRHAGVRGGSIVLVTDRADPASLTAARRAHAGGANVSVLGIGSTRGGPVPLGDGSFMKDEQGAIVMASRDDASLSAVAAAGGGRFVAVADDGSDIAALAGVLHADGGGKAVDGAKAGEWQDRGPWLLLPLLPIVALAFRRGWLLVLALAVLPWSPGARADGLDDVFRTRDQQAAQALRQGDAKRAQALAQSVALRGAAAYKAGDFAAAEAALKTGTDSDSQYNLGNTMAKQQRYDEAIAAYDRALKVDPNNADAAANRKAVDDFLKKQKPSDASKNPSSGNGKPPSRPGDKGDKAPSDQPDPGKDNAGSEGGQPSSGEDKNQGQPDKGKPDKSGQDESQDGGKDNGSDKEGGKDGDKAPSADAAARSAAERAQAERAQAALKEQMDQALAGKADPSDAKDGAAAHDLGALSSKDAASKLPADVQRALLRVPDDPGRLLRRKFMLEYQQRHGTEPEE